MQGKACRTYITLPATSNVSTHYKQSTVQPLKVYSQTATTVSKYPIIVTVI